MEPHWLDAKVGERHELVLENLPYPAGLTVEVLVVPRLAASAGIAGADLLNSVIEYCDPFDPVADADWEASR